MDEETHDDVEENAGREVGEKVKRCGECGGVLNFLEAIAMSAISSR